jgi:UDP-glucuronate 4-epimerase
MRPVLVTGVAGFIGYSFARRLLATGRPVVGADNINNYYDPLLKQARLGELSRFTTLGFRHLDLADQAAAETLFGIERFERVVHLAAQAGVRYSLENPHAYVDANLSGFINVLEGCRRCGCEHLLFASSSSVYGANTRLPFSLHDNVDHPVSLYAATKKANEVMAHAYSYLYGLPAAGLRFFTVYGPWGRPDMAYFLFSSAIMEGRPITLFNHGRMRRDFTYVDDVTDAMERLLDRIPVGVPGWKTGPPNPATSLAPWRLYNIGNNRSVELGYLVDLLEKALWKTATRQFAAMQPGDVPETCADIDDLVRDVGFKPRTGIEEGISTFVDWYRSYRAGSRERRSPDSNVVNQIMC